MRRTGSVWPRLDAVFEALLHRASALSRRSAWTLTIASYAILAVVDGISGREYSIGGFYLVPTAIAAWAIGARAGFATSLVSSVTMIVLNGLGDEVMSHSSGSSLPVMLWNGFMLLLWSAIMSGLIVALRRAFVQVRLQTMTDDLTGAMTKRAFADHVRRVLGVDPLRRPVLVYAYVDLDSFKQVNDRHGHLTGDSVLRDFAGAAGQAMRPRDALARLGGDEFAMLMIVDTTDDAYRLAERVHREIAGSLAGLPTPVTCSMGAVVVENAASDDGPKLTAAADALMYEVKRAGRNALRVAALNLARPTLQRAA